MIDNDEFTIGHVEIVPDARSERRREALEIPLVQAEGLIDGTHAIMPIEPSEEMIERGIDEFDNIYDPDVPREFLFKEIYKAMTKEG